MENKKNEILAEKHPCFNKDAKHKYARVHLPVAPKCNVQCGYCNRKYDCVNESRPGITSKVLKPEQALNYFKKINKHIPNISTIGIAGPGDAFAEPELTMETIRMIHKEFPDKIYCISTNGLNIGPYVDELKNLGVSHVTLTINSLNPENLAKVYTWIRHKKKMYRGIEAGRIIAEEQMKALKLLSKAGIKIKINSVVIPGINEDDIIDVAKKGAEEGAETMNCLPLISAEGSAFEDYKKPDMKVMSEIKTGISGFIKPMTHCAKCRADAAGKIGNDVDIYKFIEECTTMPTVSNPQKPFVAVASYEGILINQHLGESESLYIFKKNDKGYELADKREAPKKGMGDIRWIKLAKILSDCSYLLVNGVGEKPSDILQKAGVPVVEMQGLIEDGLDAIYKGEKLKTVIKTTKSKCGSDCGGNGQGCG